MRGIRPADVSALDCLNGLKRLHNAAVSILDGLTVDGDRDEDGLCRCYFWAMVEHSGSLILLLENEASAGFGSILRTYFECYVRFSLLCRSEAEARNVKYKYYSGEEKFVRRALARGAIPEDAEPEFESYADFCAENAAALKAAGAQDRKIKIQIEEVGLGLIYDSVWYELCDISHLGLRTVWKHHFNPELSSFTAYDDFDLHKFKNHLSVARGLMLSAAQAFCEHFEISGTALNTELELALTDLQGCVPEHPAT